MVQEPDGVCHKNQILAPIARGILWSALAGHRLAHKNRPPTYRKAKSRREAFQNPHNSKSSIAKKPISRVNFRVWKIQTLV
jgi:hypothetical protein